MGRATRAATRAATGAATGANGLSGDQDMLVRFWGTRGSLPVAPRAEAVRQKVAAALLAANGRRFEDRQAAVRFVDEELDFDLGGTYGGATSCVEIESCSDEFLVCDMGSGLRGFGLDSARRTAEGRAKTYNFLMSHLHWDHIMGFPFFAPAFDPDAVIRVFGGHRELEEALRRQQERISFPVPFDMLKAQLEFRTLEPGPTYDVGGYRVSLIRQAHDNDSYGYRIEAGGRTVVYTTDSEHRSEEMDAEKAFVAFFAAADLVVFDTMYSLADSVSVKQDWGHSSNVVAVDLCHRAAARKLAMFHHEPIHDDEMISRIHRETVRYEELMRRGAPLEVVCAYDGMEITV